MPNPLRITGILGLLLVAGACGCSESADRTEPAGPSAPPPLTAVAKEAGPGAANLLEARAGFQTRLQPSGYEADGPATDPPPGVFELVEYRSEVGDLVAYVTPDPKDGRKHPAVLWAHGGFGGIGSWLWEPASRANDQSARAFREAGIVLMCPSWRGENDNPGQYEMFFGEVNDLLAARDFLAALPYVDARRIYVAGHSTGGTMALLAAEATDKFRAAFSFGGAPDVGRVVSDGRGYGNTPFDFRSPEECSLRSPINFVRSIKTPTFYFEGQGSSYCGEALEMEQRARQIGAPFTACIIRGGNHFNILAPLTEYVAAQIQRDTGDRCNVSISPETANRVFQTEWAQRRRVPSTQSAQLPLLELTPVALEKILDVFRRQSLDLDRDCLRITKAGERWGMSFDSFNPRDDLKVVQGPLTVLIPKQQAEDVRGCVVDYVERGGKGGFVFRYRSSE